MADQFANLANGVLSSGTHTVGAAAATSGGTILGTIVIDNSAVRAVATSVSVFVSGSGGGGTTALFTCLVPAGGSCKALVNGKITLGTGDQLYSSANLASGAKILVGGDIVSP